jgi:AIPR protein
MSRVSCAPLSSTKMFEHFLGEENAVNEEIAETLNDADRRDLFSILNNGITIISPDVRVQGSAIFIRDFQIVNGCQTSNVLYECRGQVDESVMVTTRVIEVDDPKIVGEVIRATNNQTKIDEVQFLSLKPIMRKVEAYFDARGAEPESEDIRLYFERRSRQFVGQGIPDIRIFDMKEVARAVAAMFLERPDLAARYPTQMFDELSNQLLDANNYEAPYFCGSAGVIQSACLH